MQLKPRTYLDFIMTFLARTFFLRRRGTTSISLNILGGSHKGSVIAIEQDEIRIGTDISDDILLLDESAKGGAVVVAVERTLFGPMARVTTERNDVRVDDQPLNLARSFGSKTFRQTFRLPCLIEVGPVPIRFQADPKAEVGGLYRREIYQVAVLCLLTLMTLFGTLNYLAQLNPEMQVVSPRELPDTPTATVSAPDVAPVSLALQSSGLDRYLTVAGAQDNTVRILGDLPQAQKDAWANVLRDLDNRAKSFVLISEVTVVPDRPDIPSIAVVRRTPDPALIFADDSVALIGDEVSNGWVLASIDNTSFDLVRDDVLIKVDF